MDIPGWVWVPTWKNNCYEDIDLVRDGLGDERGDFTMIEENIEPESAPAD